MTTATAEMPQTTQVRQYRPVEYDTGITFLPLPGGRGHPTLEVILSQHSDLETIANDFLTTISHTLMDEMPGFGERTKIDYRSDKEVFKQDSARADGITESAISFFTAYRKHDKWRVDKSNPEFLIITDQIGEVNHYFITATSDKWLCLQEYEGALKRRNRFQRILKEQAVLLSA